MRDQSLGRAAGRCCCEMLEGRRLLAQVPAFPGAEGFGMFTSGGRGGTVYEVTNLNDSGAGSLRDAVSQPNRTVVFRVSGTISLNSTLSITQNNITIAGQTAPGDGITLKNYALRIGADNIIIRYIRVRPGDTGNDSQVDGIGFLSSGASNVIFDHVSASWGIDENFSFYGLPNVTIQWSIISEALMNSKHPSGAHSMGGIMNGRDMTAHHNIFISNNDRNPKFNIADWWPGQNTDFRNNVVYNWGARATWGGNGGSSLTNVVNNYYKAGPSSTNPSRFLQLEGGNPGEWYVDGNYVHGFPAITANNWSGVTNASGGGALNAVVSSVPFASAPVTTQSALDAYDLVLAHAGANIPLRDAVDTRVLNDVVNGTGAIINTQNTVGGWPTLNSTAAPADADHDGMPDAYEIANALNPNNAADRNGVTAEGYTNLEIYLNSLVPNLGSISTPVLPAQAFWPFPANGATQTDAAPELKWKAGFKTASERIYFGTSPILTEADFKLEKPHTSQVVNKQLITSSVYSPGQLENGVTYYWRIDGVSTEGVTTGPTWSFTPGLPVLGPPQGGSNRMEAEQMTLARAFVESTWAAVPSDVGSMRFTFNKNPGLYRIDVRHIDEGDGAGLFEVFVNNTLAGSWIANVNNDQFVTRSFDNILINPGDVVKVVSRRHQDELGRVDYVDTVFQSADVVAPTVSAKSFDFESGHRLRFQFSEGINLATISTSDLQVQLQSGGPVLNPDSVTYSAATRIATFAFAAPLANGDYRATLAAGNVADPSGNPLATASQLDFFVLAGDANRDRKVDVADLGILASNWQASPRTFSQGNFDYSVNGLVDVADLGILASNWQQQAAASAAAIAPLVKSPRDTPTRVATLVL